MKKKDKQQMIDKAKRKNIAAVQRLKARDKKSNSRSGVNRNAGTLADKSASKKVKWDDFEDLPPQYDPIVVR